ncbi:yae1 domain-containing protein 1 [Fopius arisanus]|uniref:Yae1 domain-containing protein 1 n=1 Tax=Fopius arisanus TaxID=64838 RepID=A0A9R1U171_9HYME|nr:PREDICTED: yae1 domain-containing protein 1-like [Fopius arisanus]
MEDCENDETLDLASRTWSRVMESASKAGYREGVDEGSQEVLQSDFDVGYSDGFKISFLLGKYKALAALNPEKIPPDIQKILEATRRGECHICHLESSGEINLLESQEVIRAHRDHITKIIHKLKENFSPLLREKNIKIEEPELT